MKQTPRCDREEFAGAIEFPGKLPVSSPLHLSEVTAYEEAVRRVGAKEGRAGSTVVVISAVYCEVGFDPPDRADVEATLQPGQSVVVAVPKDGGPYPQHTFHGINCFQEPFIGYG